MRVSIVLATFAAVASASTLGKRQYPSCAMPCIMAADFGTCSNTDNTCLCKSDAFVNSTATCFTKSCQGDDLANANRISAALCAAAGVTLTSSQTATATATGAATSTSSSNSAINLSGSPMIGALAAMAGVVFAL